MQDSVRYEKTTWRIWVFLYDLNDVGNNNKWIYVRMQTDGTTDRDLVTEDGHEFLP